MKKLEKAVNDMLANSMRAALTAKTQDERNIYQAEVDILRTIQQLIREEK